MRPTIIVADAIEEHGEFRIHRALWPGLGPGYVVAVERGDMTTFWWLSDDSLIYWNHPLRVGGVADAAYIHFSFEPAPATPAPAYWHIPRILRILAEREDERHARV